jgi:hypothetical protein
MRYFETDTIENVVKYVEISTDLYVVNLLKISAA